MPALDRIQARIQQVKRLGLYRQLCHHQASDGVYVRIGDRWLVNFSSNDYLGLAQHPALKSASIDAIQQRGTGSGASRLVTGSSDLHASLEREIANWKSTDSAVLFNSGYQANLGTLGALTKSGDRIFYDARSHASLLDGIQLSRATPHEFNHNDVDHLATLLHQHDSKGIRAIVTESVFSMDGDLAPLSQLMELATAHDCLLVVDEAHAIGVFGPKGAGLCAQWNLASDLLIQVGTCGKALGSFGAYVACHRTIADLLRNRARSFIYTTALPPATLAATQAAIHYLAGHSDRQHQLQHNRRYFERYLGVSTTSQIFPLVLGSSADAVSAAQTLFQQGLWVQAIRPPTVPHGTARLRISLSAAHTPEQIDRLCIALDPLIDKHGIKTVNNPNSLSPQSS